MTIITNQGSPAERASRDVGADMRRTTSSPTCKSGFVNDSPHPIHLRQTKPSLEHCSAVRAPLNVRQLCLAEANSAA